MKTHYQVNARFSIRTHKGKTGLYKSDELLRELTSLEHRLLDKILELQRNLKEYEDGSLQP
jgi:hypothetical protein